METVKEGWETGNGRCVMSDVRVDRGAREDGGEVHGGFCRGREWERGWRAVECRLCSIVAVHGRWCSSAKRRKTNSKSSGEGTTQQSSVGKRQGPNRLILTCVEYNMLIFPRNGVFVYLFRKTETELYYFTVSNRLAPTASASASNERTSRTTHYSQHRLSFLLSSGPDGPRRHVARGAVPQTQSHPQPLFPLLDHGSSHARQSITLPRRWYAVSDVFGTRYLQFSTTRLRRSSSATPTRSPSRLVGGAGKVAGDASGGSERARRRGLFGGSCGLLGVSEMVRRAIAVVMSFIEGWCALALVFVSCWVGEIVEGWWVLRGWGWGWGRPVCWFSRVMVLMGVGGGHTSRFSDARGAEWAERVCRR